jgi:succinyl-diaminopimelate desuccinylase
MLTPVEEKVLGAIREEETVRFLQDLVRIPTIRANEQQVAEYIAERMRGWGFQEVLVQGVEGHPGRANLVAWLRGQQRKPTLMTTAHMDVIPIETADREKWIVDPFAAEIRDGKIYGRGSVDDKGGCTVLAMAAKAIVDAGVELPGDLVTALVADEENMMLGVKQFIKSGLHRSVDACLSGDPFSASTIPESRPGRIYGAVTFIGKTAHAGAPHSTGAAVNAVHKAAKFIAAMDASAPNHPAHPLYGQSFWQVLRIDGGWPGTLPAQCPDRCQVVFDIRLVPGHDPEAALADLRALLERLQAEDPDMRATVEAWDRRPGYQQSSDNPLARAVASAYQELTGQEIQYGGRSGGARRHLNLGTADTHYLIYEGIPCFNVAGPSQGIEPGHTANEALPIQVLMSSTRSAALTILRFFGL